MAKSFKSLLIFAILGLIFLVPIDVAWSVEKPEAIPQTTETIENLGEFIDLNLSFTKQDGELAKLSEIAPLRRPYIIAPVYYRCPRLCSLTLNFMLDTIKEMDLELGKDYSIITTSFNPKEGPELASNKAHAYYESAEPLEANEKSWPFLTGTPENTTKLMQEIGFSYEQDGEDFSHASVLVVLSPEGKITRYFYGFPIKPQDLKLALVEASEGIIGSTFDKVLLYCFRYDHTKGQYTFAVMNLVRVVGLLSLFAVILMIIRLGRKS